MWTGLSWLEMGLMAGYFESCDETFGYIKAELCFDHVSDHQHLKDC